MLSTISNVVKRHPLITFFVLAYALSWWLVPIGDGLFPFGPLLAVLIVVPLIDGKAGLKRWWSFITRWRGRLGWYVTAVILIFAMNLAAATLTVLLGASFPAAETITRWPELFIVFPLYLILLGPLGEETGWRGFAMPRLQEKHSALTASLILGIFVAFWHLPLVIFSEQPFAALPLMLITFAAQFILTWLANHVEGKVLIVMLAHAAQGGLGGEYFGSMFTGADAILERWLLTAVFWLVAGVIVLVTGSRLAQQRQPIEPVAVT
jgi:membrane protease YdiL (CAAX protease family)